MLRFLFRELGFWFLIIAVMRLEGINSDKKEEKPDARKHYCCARHKKTVVAGHGITGEEIKIDAGYCKSFCPRFFTDDSGDPSRPAVQKCNWSNSQHDVSYCRAKTGRLERISTIEGVRNIEVVDTCDCTSMSSSTCRAESYLQTFYQGTPYQIELDLRACVGSCKSASSSCRPVRNSSVSIRGPNGDEVHEIIERCSCAGNCHRMDLIETILDFSRVELKGNMNIADAVPTLKHINVGRCVGSCSASSSGINNNNNNNNVASELQTCISSNASPIRCLAGLFSAAGNRHVVKCTPVKFKVHEFRTRRGQKREIIQITQCACV